MPTGTKIAAIVLVVILGAAGLYYAFVPPAPAPKFDPTKGSGSSVTDPLSRPSTLPPAGSSASTGTAAGIDALANRAGVTAPGTTPGATTTTPGSSAGVNSGANTTAPAGAVAGATNVPGTTVPGASNPTTPRTTFNNGFRNGPGAVVPPGTNVGTTGTGANAGIGSPEQSGLAAGGTGTSVGTNPTGTSSVGTGTTTGTGAGNSSGLTGSNPATVLPSGAGNTTGSETTYIVKKGDSFESISKALYGTITKWKDIAKANPTVDPTRMKIGAKLRIPAAGASISNETSIASASSGSASGASSSSSGKSSTKSAAGATSGGTHVVAKGDTFSSLARAYYGDSKFWKAIAKANPKISEKSLSIGTKVAIPPKSTVVSGGNVER